MGSWPVLVALLAFIGSLVGLYLFYWVIRLAVRHGIEDARRRREQQASEESAWDPARH
jgi:protein-S-isoprenylcysteine O-methyltransferase Ste14